MKINKFNLIIFFGLSLLINFNLKSMDSPGADSRGAREVDVESGFAGAVAPGAMVRQGTSGIDLGFKAAGSGDVAFDGSKDAGEILVDKDGTVTGLVGNLRHRRGGPASVTRSAAAAPRDSAFVEIGDNDPMLIIAQALQDSSKAAAASSATQAAHLEEYKKENDEQRVREVCSRRMAVTGVVLSVAAFGIQVGTMIWGNGEDA